MHTIYIFIYLFFCPSPRSVGENVLPCLLGLSGCRRATACVPTAEHMAKDEPSVSSVSPVCVQPYDSPQQRYRPHKTDTHYPHSDYAQKHRIIKSQKESNSKTESLRFCLNETSDSCRRKWLTVLCSLLPTIWSPSERCSDPSALIGMISVAALCQNVITV